MSAPPRPIKAPTRAGTRARGKNDKQGRLVNSHCSNKPGYMSITSSDSDLDGLLRVLMATWELNLPYLRQVVEQQIIKELRR